MDNFRMKLNAKDGLGTMAHCRDWVVCRVTDDLKIFWQAGEMVAMAHPNLRTAVDRIKEIGCLIHLQRCAAVFPVAGRVDLST
jgi:hypothetical protein